MITQKLQILIDAQDRASKKLVGVKNKLEGMKVGMRKAGMAATVMGAAITYASLQVLKIASAAEETQSKFNVVFRGMEDTMNKWAEGFASDVGRARQDIKAFSAGIADVLKPMGMQTDMAAEMSKKMVQLALDVASFNNRQDEEVIRSFTSALTGERESLKTLGIVITEADVKAEAYSEGLARVGDELTKTAKAQATINLLFKMSKDAQGDLIRTSESYANRVKALNGALKDLKEIIGNQLLPVVTPLVDKMIEVVKRAEDWIVKNPKWAAGIIKVAAGGGMLLAVLGPLLILLPGIVTAFTLLLTPLGTITFAIGLMSAAVMLLIKNWKKMVDSIRSFLGLTVKATEDEAEAIVNVKNRVVEAMDNITEATKITKEAINEAKKRADELGNSLQEIIDIEKERFEQEKTFGVSIAEAYVEQEKKIKDIRDRLAKETDEARADQLTRELIIEEEALRKRSHLLKLYYSQIQEERRLAGLTEFGRGVEEIYGEQRAFETRQRGALGEIAQTYNFDFRGANISDIEKLKMTIIDALNRASELALVSGD